MALAVESEIESEQAPYDLLQLTRLRRGGTVRRPTARARGRAGGLATHTRRRTASGAPLIELQNTRFELAECATLAHAGRVFADSCVERHLRGELDAATAAMTKWWLTDVQCQVIDRCLQLFGGYGYMREYPIARMYADARAQRIYGGTNELMKEIITRSLSRAAGRAPIGWNP
ncbi:Acyl-CoA dehydrogenase, C-terminal domain [Thermomonospora echinospora]|uniref:Acyl-CoA dehydrogenase, C-terminal domain n=1 Tax=Thermomonospora echinospora TaxID=1992 RepID=A0A1H6DNV0_9ACTN|nr:Acyl-CoA dehydrogenase, C-terminal domain [Thermomonospora echinospora]